MPFIHSGDVSFFFVREDFACSVRSRVQIDDFSRFLYFIVRFHFVDFRAFEIVYFLCVESIFFYIFRMVENFLEFMVKILVFIIKTYTRWTIWKLAQRMRPSRTKQSTSALIGVPTLAGTIPRAQSATPYISTLPWPPTENTPYNTLMMPDEFNWNQDSYRTEYLYDGYCDISVW